MPRRVADYPDAFSDWNFVSSLGAYHGRLLCQSDVRLRAQGAGARQSRPTICVRARYYTFGADAIRRGVMTN
jgi:hypothetical protein